MEIITLIAQAKPEALPIETIGVGGVAAACLAFVLWFARQMHLDGKAERAEWRADRKATDQVIERNTDAHIRANIIMSRVEDRMDRDDRRQKST